MAKTHILKTLATVWDAVAAGKKPWEIRRNDRFFQVGDIVVLRKIHDEGDMSPGAYVQNHDSKSGFYDLEFRIGWMLQITGGYCIFSLDPIEPAKTLYWSEPDCEPVSDIGDLTPVDFWEVSPAIHSNVAPHTRWAVRVPIGQDDGEGGTEIDGEEVEWFDSPQAAQTYINEMTKPEEPIGPFGLDLPSRGEGQADG